MRIKHLSILLIGLVLIGGYLYSPSGIKTARAEVLTCNIGTITKDGLRVTFPYSITLAPGSGSIEADIDFGDDEWDHLEGGSATLAHTYASDGTYTIGLTCYGGPLSSPVYTSKQVTVSGGSLGFYYTCNSSEACVRKTCSGTCPPNDCAISADCAVPPGTPRHKACVSSTCSWVDGEGTNDCSSIGESCGGSGTATHNICGADFTCKQVSGGGANQCGNADDCLTPVKVVVNSNYEGLSWKLTDCPSFGDNSNGTTGDCDKTYKGSRTISDLQGPGPFTLKPTVVPGYRLVINGVSRSSDTLTVPSTPKTTQTLLWNVELVKDCDVTLTTNTSTSTPGSSVQAYWKNNKDVSYPGDWIAVVPAGSAWGQGYPWSWWNGTTGAMLTEAAPLNGGLSLAMPGGTPKIEFVYYAEGGYAECGRSAPVTLVPNTTNYVTMGCRANDGVWSSGPCSIPYGQMAKVHWAAPNALSCAINIPWVSSESSGQADVGPITQSQTYTATCSWPVGKAPLGISKAEAQSGVVTASVTLVPSGDSNTPFVNLMCSDGQSSYQSGVCQIRTGNNAMLKWTSGNVSNCKAKALPGLGGWSGFKPDGGVDGVTESVGPLNKETTAIITCRTGNGVGPGGDEIESSVRLVPVHNTCINSSCVPVPGEGLSQCSDGVSCTGGTECTFAATPDRIVIPPVRQSTLTWNCQNVHDCSITPTVGIVNISGTARVYPQATTNYHLSCTDIDSGAPVERDATIRIFRFDGGALREILPRLFPQQ
ncbi:MAG: PKD domain-containing protein [Candidatus Liptonbacteria bacterium]